MSSHHDDVEDFWSGQRDWTDSHPRHRHTGRTPLGQRLKTGMQSVFDAGATASRAHGQTGSNPVAEPVSHVAGDLDFDLTPEPSLVRRTGDGMTIGELARPFDSGIDEPTQPVRRVAVGVATPPTNRAVEPAPADTAALSDDYSGLAVETDPWDEEWDAAGPVDVTRGGVDPLLAKLGVIAVVLTLAAGVFLSMRDGGSDDAISTADSPSTLPAESGGRQQASGKAEKQGDSGRNAGATGGAAATGAQPGSEPKIAVESAPAESAAPAAECGTEYQVVEGDYWLRLADGSGASLNELLSVNGASTDTALYPGATICLPVGASTPPPPAPPTAAPADEPDTSATSGGDSASNGPTGGGSDTSQNGSGSSGSTSSGSSSSSGGTASGGSGSTPQPPATTPATTAPPTTQAPATTAPPAPKPPASASQVEQIIREVFPADQHDKALAVAWRESNHRPDVYNGWCCYGVFQIYYSVHDDWLPQFSVNQASDLYDARKNVLAAYHLYQQAGGWGPWGG